MVAGARREYAFACVTVEPNDDASSTERVLPGKT